VTVIFRHHSTQHSGNDTHSSWQALATLRVGSTAASAPRSNATRGKWGFLRAHENTNKRSITKRCSAA